MAKTPARFRWRNLAYTPVVDFNSACGPGSGSKPSISSTTFSLPVRTSSSRRFKAVRGFVFEHFEHDCRAASGKGTQNANGFIPRSVDNARWPDIRKLFHLNAGNTRKRTIWVFCWD